PLWSEIHTATALNGVVNLPLGSISVPPLALFDGTSRYVALRVGADAEMTPRRQIAAIPFARRAAGGAPPDSPTAIPTGLSTSAHILDGTIATADLANGSVTGAKLAAAAVTLSSLAAGSVDASKIVDGSIIAAKLAAGAVTSAAILDGTITTSKLSNGA